MVTEPCDTVIPPPVSEVEPAGGLRECPKVSRSLSHASDFRSGDLLLLHALFAPFLLS